MSATADEVQRAEASCAQYVDVIGHKYRAPAGEAPPARLQAELTNRRQFTAYLHELSAGFKQVRHGRDRTRRPLITSRTAFT